MVGRDWIKNLNLPDVRRFLLDVSSEIMGGGFNLLLRWCPFGLAAWASAAAMTTRTANVATDLDNGMAIFFFDLLLQVNDVSVGRFFLSVRKRQKLPFSPFDFFFEHQVCVNEPFTLSFISTPKRLLKKGGTFEFEFFGAEIQKTFFTLK